MKITRTKSGKWTCRLAVPGENGKRKFLRFTDADKNRLRQTVANYAAEHTYVADSLAFEAVLTRLMDDKARTLRPSTLHGYRAAEKTLRSQYAAFCRKSVDRITDRDVQALINDMHARGLRPKTIKNYIGLVSETMRSEGCAMPQVCIPRGAPPAYRVPDADTIRRIAAAASGTRMEIPVALAVLGLRRGEICAVRSSDLDGDVLHVARAISDGVEMDTPKTDSSIRAVVLPPRIAELIRERGCAWDASASALSCAWPRLCDEAQVERFRLHDCRHFFVSYCHDVLRLSDAQIMKLGGWRTDRVMKTHYRHALSDASGQVASAIGELVEWAQK